MRDFAKANGLSVWIDRRNGGRWQNPFEIGKDKDRQEVCEKYKNYFHNELLPSLNSEGLESLKALKGRALYCHCYPLRCHGETIIDWLENQN